MAGFFKNNFRVQSGLDLSDDRALEAGAKAGETAFYGGKIYTKKELELFLSCLENDEPVIALHTAVFSGGRRLYDYPELKYEDILKKLDEIKDRDDETAIYEKLFLER